MFEGRFKSLESFEFGHEGKTKNKQKLGVKAYY